MSIRRVREGVTILAGLAIGLGPIVILVLAFGAPSSPVTILAAADTPNPLPSPGHVDVHPHAAPSPVPLSDCATTDFSTLLPEPGETGPNVGELDTAYDPEARTLSLTATDHTTMKDVTFNVSVDDPACQNVPVVDGQVDEALKELAQDTASECADVRGQLASGVATIAKGTITVPFNVDAASDFIIGWCGWASPSVTPAS